MLWNAQKVVGASLTYAYRIRNLIDSNNKMQSRRSRYTLFYYFFTKIRPEYEKSDISAPPEANNCLLARFGELVVSVGCTCTGASPLYAFRSSSPKVQLQLLVHDKAIARPSLHRSYPRRGLKRRFSANIGANTSTTLPRFHVAVIFFFLSCLLRINKFLLVCSDIVWAATVQRLCFLNRNGLCLFTRVPAPPEIHSTRKIVAKSKQQGLF